MAFLASARLLFVRARVWAGHHGGEVFWAAAFAVVFGVPLALYFAKYFIDLPPYKIYLIAGSHYLNESTDYEHNTESQFKSAAELSGLNIDGVPVRLEVVELSDDKPETALSKARELVDKDETILVIGHLDSEPTEGSLATYFKARPQVPFIASVQTDDNLLKKALVTNTCNEDPTCYDGPLPLPYLQLSPDNEQQAHWALQFATQNERHHFLIVESDTSNIPYSKSLAQDYVKAVDELIRRDPGVTKQLVPVADITRDKLREDLKDGDIDCLLYAGGFDDVPPLLKKVADVIGERQDGKKSLPADNSVMVILDDSVVERRMESTKFDLNAVNIANQADAQDYQNGLSVYGLDAIAVASQLINDVDNRGLDFRYRLKAFFRLQKGSDVRRNLVRTMQENFAFRSSYLGATATSTSLGARTIYAFDQYSRVNGMFHIWSRTGYESVDVDRWHPPRMRLMRGQATDRAADFNGRQDAALSPRPQ